MNKITTTFFLLLLFTINFSAQEPKKPSSGAIFESIQKLQFLGSVLYVAAHPDDENTRLISYFSNNVKARTGYLSITRGDGGQNLIGNELGELLGVIRTQELLAARKIDGGEQFFTRANDFGYSKHSDETLDIWNKKEVLNDVVATIRKFKPDIIINRFDARTPGSTHGHHTSSAILSFEAFDLASNKNYATHLTHDDTWNPKRLFFNTSWWFYGGEEEFKNADKTNLIDLEIGTFYPVKGLSNSEIAALSRSQHQSQGFGSSGSRGKQTEYLEFLKGDFPKNKNIWDGIDTSWSRIEGGKAVGDALKKVEVNFDFSNPASSVPQLLEAYRLIENLKETHWKSLKINEIKQVIANCLGLYFEFQSKESIASQGDEVDFTVEFINRSNAQVVLKEVTSVLLNYQNHEVKKLDNNVPYFLNFKAQIPTQINYTSPYWLQKKGSIGMYNVSKKDLIGLPENELEIVVNAIFEIEGISIPIRKTVIFKRTDPVKGELYKPFEIIPKITANFLERVFIFSSNKEQNIAVKLKSGVNNFKGEVSLCYPNNWIVSPSSIPIEITNKDEEKIVEFSVIPPIEMSEGLISPMVLVDTETYSQGSYLLNYNHIPEQTVLMNSEAKIVRLNIKSEGNIVGYIHGAGDVIPENLRQMGYTVIELKEDDISLEKIENFDAIVLGVRAYNTNENAKFYQPILHKYVENGGNLIVQYNTNFRLKVNEVAPYSIKLSRDRVTNEKSPVEFLNANHEVLNFPNKINLTDFDGWVQERGLYFPEEWDPKFEPILGLNDPNEPQTKGSLLVANYGKGYFVYTGLSFFRQLPAGVSGAYKLFANMVSLGKNNNQTKIKY